MEAYYTGCPACSDFDHEVLFQAFYHGVNHPFENIVICSKCGCVFRNPVVPDNGLHYANVHSWGDGNVFKQRFQTLSQFFRDRQMLLRPGMIHLDIGSGPGWFTEILHRDNPNVRVVLLEPTPEVGEYARQLNPNAVVVPSRIDEAVLPEGSFDLITACGVDYLFRHYRRDLGKIAGLLHQDGTFYIERNVFIPQRAWALQTIHDIEDMFAVNNTMNVWFHRDQFVECMSRMFDVVESVEYSMNISPAGGKSSGSELKGLFCKKKSDSSKNDHVSSWYLENLKHLQGLAYETSIAQLKSLKSQGVQNIAICGTGEEAHTLANIVRHHEVFSISTFLCFEEDPANTLGNAPVGDLREFEQGNDIDAILIASIDKQDEYSRVLSEKGLADMAFPCFRKGINRFASTTSKGNKLQIKAFMPYTLAEQKRTALQAAQREPTLTS